MATGAGDHQARLKAALEAMRKQQARIDRLERALAASQEPIAVVGIGCRLPGGVDGPETFWRKLIDGFDGIQEMPADRWPVDAFYDADPDAAGCVYTRKGGFLDGIDRFDARFFQISPREARTMDPQQRLLLEVAWRALEHAGIAPETIAGSATGVFVGITALDYARVICRDDLSQIDTYTATGNVANIAAGRLSYFFGLRGPSIAVDTACSSSLVSIHLACQSLRTGESEMAIAAGVNVMAAPDNFVAVSRAHMLSPDGRCKAFDRAANGYGRSEGCGAIVLKRLSTARADRDRIFGVILGSAVRQDGHRSGLTVPNGPAQTAVMHAALESGRVAPSAVGYLEAHGTGTSLGDPIEFEALGTVYGAGRDRARPLVVGSLKTNVGHMESAAGVGGVIKALLTVAHGDIPPHLHFHEPNPEIDLDAVPATIPVRLTPWPSGYERRIAGVSSFGSSGTIAHVIVAEPEAADAPPAPVQAPATAAPFVLPISAKTERALDDLVDAYRRQLTAASVEETANICYTAAIGRAHFARRVAVEGTSGAELAEKLARREMPSTGAGRAYVDGAEVDWRDVHRDSPCVRVDVPVYPFQRERYWIERPALPRATKTAARAVAGERKLRFGVMFFNGAETRDGSDSYRLVVQAARFADAHGFSSVWLPERHFTNFGSLYPNPATIHAALARETRSVRLMAGSVVLPLHNPLRLAEEWAVVDNLSGGRVGMSFASGWNPDDFALQPDAYGNRRTALFDGIDTLRRLWRGERVTVQNGAGASVAVRTYPTPVQPELPLWVTAAANPETFRRAGEIGAHVLTHLLDHDADELAEKIAVYRRARADHGHDPDAGEVTVMLHTFVGETLDGVHDKVREPYCRYLKDNIHLLKGLAAARGSQADIDTLSPDDLDGFVRFLYDRFFSTRALLGTTGSCLPLVERLEAIGVSEIACLLDFGPSVDDVLEQLPALAELASAARSNDRSGGARAGATQPLTATAAYRVDWERVDIEHRPAAIARAGRWAAIGDTLTAVADHLVAAGSPCEMFSSEQLASADGAAAIAGALAHADCRELIVEWTARRDDPEDLVQRTLAMTRLLQALSRQSAGRPPRVWFVTRGAHAIDAAGAPDGAPDEAAYALWGFARVLPIEALALWGGLIDLDPAASAGDNARRLTDVVVHEGRQDQVAIRGDAVLAARLAPVAIEPRTDAGWHCRADVSYLITGGFGGIGLGAAAWLRSKGATHVVLAGRTPLPADDPRIASLVANGLDVEPVAIDIANAEAFSRWIASRAATGAPAIAGVVHAAGVWDDRHIVDLDEAALRSVFAPKVHGTLALDAAFPPGALDFFVVFSAFSSLLPAERQASYAAANAFADAVVARRRAAGDRAFAINWGVWAGVGFGATDYGRRAHERLAAIGIGRIAPAEGWATLDRLIGLGVSGVGIMPVDWRRLFEADPNARLSPMLSRLAAAWAVAPEGGDAPGQITESLANLSSGEQLAAVEAALTGIVAGVMRIERRELDRETPLIDLGLDSLMAVEIKNRIQHDTKINLPLVQLLEGPPIAELATSILAAIKMSGLTAGGAPGTAAPSSLEEIEI